MTRFTSMIRAAALLLPVACAGARSAPEDSAASERNAAPPAAPIADTGRRARASEQPVAVIARLEREARALARTDGCTTAGDCRTAPVGWRACGGPRTYVVYCAATTDTAALFRTLHELERVERASLAAAGAMGTCQFVTPPDTRLEGSRCREAPSTLKVDAPQ